MKESNIDLARRLEGYHTVETLERDLYANRARVIYILYKLRKLGFVITKRNSRGKRLYRISPRYALGGTSYIDVLNKNTPIKMASSEVYEIYGEKPSIEETLVYFINKKEIRYIISSLALFKKIRNWSKLYHLAKEKDLVREIAALYDLARMYFPKLRRMPKRFRNLAAPKEKDKYKYVIDKFRSRDFYNLEKKWKVYIPLNVADLREYKGVFIS